MVTHMTHILGIIWGRVNAFIRRLVLGKHVSMRHQGEKSSDCAGISVTDDVSPCVTRRDDLLGETNNTWLMCGKKYTVVADISHSLTLDECHSVGYYPVWFGRHESGLVAFVAIVQDMEQ